MDLTALPLLNFFEDLSLIMLILVSFTLYKWMKNWAPSPTIAMLVTLIIVLLLLVPFVWFRYLMFFIIVFGSFIGPPKAGGGH